MQKVAVTLLAATSFLSGCASESTEPPRSVTPELTPGSASSAPSNSSSSVAQSHPQVVTTTKVVTAPATQHTSYVRPTVTTHSSPAITPSTSNRVIPPSDSLVAEADSDIFQAGPYGPVQIHIVVVDGIITDIFMLRQPDGSSHSRDISNGVFPTLIDSALSTQNGDLGIASVTGASYSYVAFKQALQNALMKIA